MVGTSRLTVPVGMMEVEVSDPEAASVAVTSPVAVAFSAEVKVVDTEGVSEAVASPVDEASSTEVASEVADPEPVSVAVASPVAVTFSAEVDSEAPSEEDSSTLVGKASTGASKSEVELADSAVVERPSLVSTVVAELAASEAVTVSSGVELAASEVVMGSSGAELDNPGDAVLGIPPFADPVSSGCEVVSVSSGREVVDEALTESVLVSVSAALELASVADTSSLGV